MFSTNIYHLFTTSNKDVLFLHYHPSYWWILDNRKRQNYHELQREEYSTLPSASFFNFIFFLFLVGTKIRKILRIWCQDLNQLSTKPEHSMDKLLTPRLIGMIIRKKCCKIKASLFSFLFYYYFFRTFFF